MAPKTSDNKGFTLIELMVVIAIIGILAAVAVPAFSGHRERATLRQVASDLRTFGQAFKMYEMEYGVFPPDSHLDIPYHLPPGSGMEVYLPLDAWVNPTPLGGNYNWEGPNNYPYAGISLFAATADASVMQTLDSMMDDGDLTTGNFRLISGRYTYIVFE
jgi:type IV pilus assembly protein PilA